MVGADPSPQAKTSVIGLNDRVRHCAGDEQRRPTCDARRQGIQSQRQGDLVDRERLGRALDPAVAVIHGQGDDVRAVIRIGVGRGQSRAGRCGRRNPTNT